jgi:hypothetical protein
LPQRALSAATPDPSFAFRVTARRRFTTYGANGICSRGRGSHCAGSGGGNSSWKYARSRRGSPGRGVHHLRLCAGGDRHQDIGTGSAILRGTLIPSQRPGAMIRHTFLPGPATACGPRGWLAGSERKRSFPWIPVPARGDGACARSRVVRLRSAPSGGAMKKPRGCCHPPTRRMGLSATTPRPSPPSLSPRIGAVNI